MDAMALYHELDAVFDKLCQPRYGLTRRTTELGKFARKVTWICTHPEFGPKLHEATSFLPEDAPNIARFYCYWEKITERPSCVHCGKPVEVPARFQLVDSPNGKKKAGFGQFCGGKGSPCIARASQTTAKKKETAREKYGEDHWMRTEKVKRKVARTTKQKYGVERYAQTDEFKDRMKLHNKEHYGIEAVSPFSRPEVQAKRIATFTERYDGAVNPMEIEEFVQKAQAGKRDEFLDRLFEGDRLKGASVEPLFTREEYKGCYGWTVRYPFRCTAEGCGYEFQHTITDGVIPVCPQCSPRGRGGSAEEQTLFQYVRETLGVEDAEQHVLGLFPDNPRMSVDIYVPSKRLAIEYHGLFWHSQRGGDKDRNYHQFKHVELQKQGITLIQLFADQVFSEDGTMLPIAQSVIRAKLGLAERVAARKCKVVTGVTGYRRYLADWHLQGAISGTYPVGLELDGELVALALFGRERFTGTEGPRADWELLRYCTKPGIAVVGGLSRLLKAFKREHGGSIISYADAALGNGHAYATLGFTCEGLTGPDYWYTKNYVERLPRTRFQKRLLPRKLENFDPELSEWQNMQANGFDRIWGAGNYRFVLPA